MSITLERLRALKRQAGGGPAPRARVERAADAADTPAAITGQSPAADPATRTGPPAAVDTAALAGHPSRSEEPHERRADPRVGTGNPATPGRTERSRPSSPYGPYPAGSSTAPDATATPRDAQGGPPPDGAGTACVPDRTGAVDASPPPSESARGRSVPSLGWPASDDGTAARSAPPAAVASAGPRVTGSSGTAASLDSLRRLLGVRERRPSRPPSPRAPLDRSLPGIEIAAGLHYIEARLPFAAPEHALPLAFARRDTYVDPRDLLFFDTETTGLAGGTGTRAFMIGAADWVDDTLRVRQLLISTMAAEAAMLREFATWLSRDTVLASYNGRSYDAPLLKTRYRLARLPDPLTALDHLDLLHPTRRRYRGRWENCRLATIERELLRIVREDDLPGSQAPAAWLGFLRGGPSSLLHRVRAHNHQDVVTLAQLMLRLVEAQSAE